VALLFSIVLPPFVFASDDELRDVVLTNPSAVHDFLLNDLPVAHGHPEFFRELKAEDSEAFALNITDEQLNLAAELGQRFRSWYLNELSADFSSVEFRYATGFEHFAYDRVIQLLALRTNREGLQ
jgi:hypothetical protein